MPTEMMKDFIGKDGTITLFNELGGVQGCSGPLWRMVSKRNFIPFLM